MTDIVKSAADFARAKHDGQQRKYTGEPYFTHPSRVAAMVDARGATDCEIAAAYLHDVVEDCGVSLHEIKERFGQEVASLVGELTNTSKASGLPRATRKEMDRERLRSCSESAKRIKLCDRIDNLIDMAVTCDAPKFAVLYAEESELLGIAIGEADELLRDELASLAVEVREKYSPSVEASSQ